MRACVDATPVIDGRRANCNLASLGVQRSKPSTPKHAAGFTFPHYSIQQGIPYNLYAGAAAAGGQGYGVQYPHHFFQYPQINSTALYPHHYGTPAVSLAPPTPLQSGGSGGVVLETPKGVIHIGVIFSLYLSLSLGYCRRRHVEAVEAAAFALLKVLDCGSGSSSSSRSKVDRDPLSRNCLFTEATKDFKLLRGITTQTGMSTMRNSVPPDAISAVKIFAPYSIYKGKAALSADPLLPTFSKLESGDYRVERRGVIMLTFWPAIGERKYDWEKRQKFALSATEIGSLISLGSKDSCEFFHDPSMQSSNAGQVRKSLSIKPHADGSGYFISLSVANNIQKTNDRFIVPVTSAEFAVLRTAFTFALPHIMGWDQYTSQLPHRPNQSSPKVVPELLSSEWDR
ncbi:hypothetical protein BUALT_Bualt08G0150100 [Buddleja alternifolia]|uniref:Uncharacterized protein n=1 Tax=Buddleja alternifolia TaxID=168488 RepID=A0AAV6XHC6_9LAMI|nr:hypothetical protein BUALT_Bualt08G0150100 [Buddleja alternifolia]